MLDRTLLLGVMAAGMLLTGCPEPDNGYGYDYEYLPTITADGYAELQLVPDRAFITVEVSETSSQFIEAREAALVSAESVEEICRSHGCSVTRSELYAETAQSWNEYSYSYSGVLEYNVASFLTVELIDLELIPVIQEALIDQGVTSIAPAGFMITPSDSLILEVYEMALADASARGLRIAESEGIVPGDVQNIAQGIVNGTGMLFSSLEECVISTAVKVTWTTTEMQ